MTKINKNGNTTNPINRIRFEHFALNVNDPINMAQWYCENLGMKLIRKGPPPADARFISDPDENMMLEIYKNPPDEVPDYPNMNPLLMHICFMVDNVKGICEKLVSAGATTVDESKIFDNGDEIAMLRDPWGVPIQFIKRASSMLTFE